MSHQTQPSTQSESKYQTLTPVPPLPVLSGTGHHTGLHPGQQYGHPPPPPHPGMYGFPPHPHQMPHQHPPPVFVPGAGHTYAPSYEPLPKHMKLEADSSSPSVENSFQVPSVSSTSTIRPGIPPPPGHPGHVLHPQQLHPLPPSAQHPAQNHVQHQQQALHHHPQQQASHLRTTQVNHAVPQLPVNSHQLPPHLIHGHPPPPVSQNHQPQDQWTSDPSGQGSGSLSPGGDSNNGNEKSGKKKRKRCGECPGCLKKDNCGLCGPCKSVRSHQICKMRKCDQLKTKKEKARETAQMAAAVAAGTTSISNSAKDTASGPGSVRDSAVSPASRRTPVINGYEDAQQHPQQIHIHRPVFQNGTNSSSGPNFSTEYNSNGGSDAYGTPFNGHLKTDSNGNSEDPNNRHQMTNSRLKTLIQSRSKSTPDGQNHSDMNRNPSGGSEAGPGPPSRPSSRPPASTPPTQSYPDMKQGDVGVLYRPQVSPQRPPPSSPSVNNNNNQHMTPPGGHRPPSSSQQPHPSPNSYPNSIQGSNSEENSSQANGLNGNLSYANGNNNNNNSNNNHNGQQHDQQPDQHQSFLLNTTTSTNISTNTTNTFNDSFFGPAIHYVSGFFGNGMTDDASKGYEYTSSFLHPAQDMDVECGRNITQLDSFQAPASTSLLDLSGNTMNTMHSGSLNSNSLPPVSTFLFRDNGWWSGIKTPNEPIIEPSTDQTF